MISGLVSTYCSPFLVRIGETPFLSMMILGRGTYIIIPFFARIGETLVSIAEMILGLVICRLTPITNQDRSDIFLFYNTNDFGKDYVCISSIV